MELLFVGDFTEEQYIKVIPQEMQSDETKELVRETLTKLKQYFEPLNEKVTILGSNVCIGGVNYCVVLERVTKGEQVRGGEDLQT
jgi:hypothetical protein